MGLGGGDGGWREGEGGGDGGSREVERGGGGGGIGCTVEVCD